MGCPSALAASQACFVTDRWFTPHFSVVARFSIDAWSADIACREVRQPVWPACLMDTPGRSSSSAVRVVQDVWDVKRDEFWVVPLDVVLAHRDAVSRSAVDDFWTVWSKGAEVGLFRAYSGAGGPTEAGSSFRGRVCYEFVVGVLEVELLAAVVLADCTGSAIVMRLMFIVPSTL